MKRIRSGHTRWKAVLYEPGHIDGYDDRAVCVVIACRVTQVHLHGAHGRRVFYSTSTGGHYMAAEIGFLKRTYSSFRAACADARAQISGWEDANGITGEAG